MTAPQGRSAGPTSADLWTIVLVGVLGLGLVAGYVVLASLGRDTTGYLLFLGGPAVTTLMGALLSRRVSVVQTTMATHTAETKALVEDSVSDLDNHLTEQDEALQRTTAAALMAARGTVQQPAGVPSPRAGDGSTSGSVGSRSIVGQKAE